MLIEFVCFLLLYKLPTIVLLTFAYIEARTCKRKSNKRLNNANTIICKYRLNFDK